MHSTAAERLEFAPPGDKGSLRALGLALLIHVLLIAALTWGVSWKRSDQAASVEAELWSSLPQQAAPKLIETAPPAPAPAPAPVPTPPPPPPAIKAPEVKVSPPTPDVDIALAQEKKRKLLQEKEAEAKKAEKLREKLEAELQAKKEKEKEKKKEKEQKASEELAKRKALEEAQKAELKKQEAKDQEKHKLAAAAAEKQKLATAASAKQHQEAINRMMGLAGATGGADAKGSALKSSGPSAGYAGKVRAKVLPNVLFTDDITGNPVAEVEVSTTSDGTIMSQRLKKSSGNKAWDDAVIKAIVRTGSLPRDVDGRVPSPMIIEFRPN